MWFGFLNVDFGFWSCGLVLLKLMELEIGFSSDLQVFGVHPKPCFGCSLGFVVLKPTFCLQNILVLWLGLSCPQHHVYEGFRMFFWANPFYRFTLKL